MLAHSIPLMLAHGIPLMLAHQGGWDEILLVAAPIMVLAGLLWLANRRADKLAADEADS